MCVSKRIVAIRSFRVQKAQSGVLVQGNTTKNSPDLDEQHLIDDIWVAMDTIDLRKPYATKMPDLMDVRELDGSLVPEYRVITALGLARLPVAFSITICSAARRMTSSANRRRFCPLSTG